MTPSERRRRFVRNIRAQVRRRGLAVDEGVLRLAGSLAELQARIRQVLAGAPSDFEAARLSELLAEVDRNVDVWQRRAIGESAAGIDAAWEQGPEIVTGPLKAVGVQVGITILPASLLDELRSITIAEMADIGPVAKREIGNTIRLAVMGGMSPHEAMREIGSTLDAGPFRFIHFREETIYRTEVGRVHSIAGHRRLMDAARQVGGLKKQWIWSGKSRATHRAINHQVRPVDAPFSVAGESLMYPRDPRGSAGNTINCGCESVPYKADW